MLNKSFQRKTFCCRSYGLIVLILILLQEVCGNYLKDPTVCGRPICNNDESKFKYNSRKIYSYKSIVNINSFILDEQPSNLLVDSEFELHFINSCHGILVIKKAILTDNPENQNLVENVKSFEQSSWDDDDPKSNMFNQAVSKFPLRFYFESGNIQEVCPHSEESDWVLNFKKGLLSAFQNNMKRFDLDRKMEETDVNGICDTKYVFDSVQNGTKLLIVKTKDIRSCSSRYTLNSLLPTSPYTFQTKLRKWSPYSSDLKCTQLVDNSIITEIDCYEEHSFRPFYDQTKIERLSYTTVSQRIILAEEISTYSGESDLQLEDAIVKRDSLLFTHHIPRNENDENVLSSENLIRQMCSLSQDEDFIDYEILEEFNSLVAISRMLTYEDLSKLIKLAPTICPSGKKILFQMLPNLHTVPAIMAMKDVISSKEEIQTSTVHEWLISMALFRRHNTETIKSVSTLLEDGADAETQLAISTMVYSYCRMPGIRCDKDEIVDHIASYFEHLVENTCNNFLEFKKGIIALKSLGNTGFMNDRISILINSCIAKDSLPINLRLAAIESHRRLSCDYDRKLLLDVYRNQTIDSEMRIAAYLEVIKCPSYRLLEVIIVTLKNEEANQVGSFVWSHLKNQMKSARDSAMEIQAILQDENLSSKFTNNIMKFSQNFETSLYTNEHGTGAFLISNLIYSHRSYIPRTLMTNLTFSFFGENINLLEITLNLDGFEEYFEKLLKSDELLAMKKIELPKYVQRFIRSVPETLRDKINALPNVIKGKFVNAKIGTGIKIFGNELIYIDIDGKENVDTVIKKLNPLNVVEDFFSGKQFKFERIGLLLDSSYVSPLSVGLPLNVDLTSVGALKINAGGFLNRSNCASLCSFDFQGKLIPSIALSVVGRMGVSAFYKETNVQIKGQLFSSTAITGTFKNEGSDYIKMEFNLPKNKSDIINFETKFLSKRANNLEQANGSSAKLVEIKSCSWPILDEVFGIKVCSHHFFPNIIDVVNQPFLLFTGPIKFHFTLDKSDPTTTKYLFQYKRKHVDDKTFTSAVFETPGSSVKRLMRANINSDNETKNLTLYVKSAFNVLSAQGFYKNSPADRSLNFVLDINGQKSVDLQMSINTIKIKHGFTYEPKLSFAINGKRVMNITGSLEWIQKGQSQCKVDLNFKTNRFDGNLSGYIVTADSSFKTIMKLAYKFEKSHEEVLKLRLALNDRSDRYLNKYTSHVELESSAYPEINIFLDIKYQKTLQHLECNVEMKTNPTVKDEKNKLNVQLKFVHLKTVIGRKINSYLMIKKMSNDINVKLGFNHEETSRSYNTAIFIQYATGKEINAELDLNFPRGVTLFFDAKLIVSLPASTVPMSLTLFINEKHYNEKKAIAKQAKEYDIEFTAVWFSGHNLSLKGVFINHSTFSTTNYNIKLLLISEFFDNDVPIMGRLFISDVEYQFNVQFERNKKKYLVMLAHEYQPTKLITTNGQLQYKDSLYSVSNRIDLVKNEAVIQLHLDKYRDVHITLHSNSGRSFLNIGCDVKWDANRDPAQRFAVALDINSQGYFDFNGKITADYPGRIINGVMKSEVKDLHFKGLIKIDWSPIDSIDILLSSLWDFNKNGIVDFKGEVYTPFKGWKFSSLDFGFHWMDHGVFSNTTLRWMEDQHIKLGLKSVHVINSDVIDVSFDSYVNSTIPDVKPMRAKISHYQMKNLYETILIIQATPEHIVQFNSKGFINKSTSVNDFSISIGLMTPYSVISKFQTDFGLKLFSDKIKSDVLFLFNDKRLSVNILGTFKQFYESKLLFRMQTPYEKFSTLHGRFGISLSNRHLILQVKGPDSNTGLGAEVQYTYNNIYDFDMKLHIFTGFNIEFNSFVIAKIDSENIDFRLGWNKIIVGVVGTAHYVNIYQLEYKGFIYLPLESLSRTGGIAKSYWTDKQIALALFAVAAQKKVGIDVGVDIYRAGNLKSELSFIDQDIRYIKDDVFDEKMEDFNNLEPGQQRMTAVFELNPGFYDPFKGDSEINFKVFEKYLYCNVTSNVEIPFVTFNLTNSLRFKV